MRRFRKSSLALAVAGSLLHWSVIPAAFAGALVTAQPNVGPDIRPYFNNPATDPELSQSEMVKLLQEKIKYVFIIFNENHSFDNEYGTFPGVNGIYSNGLTPRSPANTPGFTQTYVDLETGAKVTVRPFRIGPEYNSSAIDGADHVHTAVAEKIDVNPATGVARMDKFAYEEYNRFASLGGGANEAEGTQFARVVMAHIDCDTIPFFWQWASNFTIFDNIFSTEDTSSTPNAIAMIAGQSGETQWVEHGTTGQTYQNVNANSSGTTTAPPIVVDTVPFYGSPLDSTPTDNRQPISATDANTTATGTYTQNGSNIVDNIASNLTFATLPLTFQGSNITEVMLGPNGNLNQALDLPDIQQDIPYIQALNPPVTPVNWRWYQEGYDLEATDSTGAASHVSYVTHHNGPQYFGYIVDTPGIGYIDAASGVSPSLRGLADFFSDMAGNSLPQGGVFYIRGGYLNQMKLTPPITNPSTPPAEIKVIEKAKLGDDDHPSYSDRQISEANVARVINSIASNPAIWAQCAIIITYDEGDGFYDHVPPRIRSYGPDGLPLSRGIRVPLILISPYARTHAVSHVEGDHNAVIETIEAIFGLPALASLPDEAQALVAGNSPAFNQFAPSGFEQKCLGPRDINSKISGNLLSGFDPKRLTGKSRPLPNTFAIIEDSVVTTLPHYGAQGCKAIGITPEDVRQGIIANPPAGFNPLPSTYPEANYPEGN